MVLWIGLASFGGGRASPHAGAASNPSQLANLIADGQYRDAEDLGARLLREVEARYGAESLEAADILDLLVEAQLRGFTSFRPEALERAERAIRIREKAQGLEHPEVARSLALLGQVLFVRADDARAEEVCGQALAIAEKAVGSEDAAAPESLRCLGRIHQRKWNYADAIALYERAVSALQERLGSEHPRVAGALTDLGYALREAGELARGREILERALRIREGSLRPAHPDIAGTLFHLGRLYLDLGERAQARSRLERAVQIYEQSLGPQNPRFADALNYLAGALWTDGDCTGAIRLEERALAIKEGILGSDNLILSISLYNLATSLQAKGDFDGARALYGRSLALEEKYNGAEHPKVAWRLTSLGALAMESGDLAAADSHLKRALALQEKILGPEHPQVALTLSYLGELAYGLTGSYTRARERHERALAIFETSLGPDSNEYGFALINLASLAARTGRHEDAGRLFSKGLAIRAKALGWENLNVALTLNEVAWFHAIGGEFSQARSHFEKALAMLETSLCQNQAGAARSLHGLADLHKTAGDFAEARRLYVRALSMFESALGPEHFRVAEVLGALGHLDVRLGDYTKAKESFERAVAIANSLGPDHDAVGWGLINLAIIHGRLGQLDQAKTLFERGLAIREKSIGSESFLFASSLAEFGDFLLRAGEHARAAQTFERTVSIYEKTRLTESHGIAQALAGLAEALAWVGQPERALDAALRAEEFGRRRLAIDARALAERQALRYASVRTSGLGLSLSLATSRPRPEAVTRAWDALVRSRSLVLDEMAARRRRASELASLGEKGVDQGGASEITRLSREVVQASERLSSLMVRGPGSASAEEYRQLLDQAQREQERAERALAEVSGASGEGLASGEGGLAQVLRALPHRSALLAYARYDHFAPPGPEATRSRSSERDSDLGALHARQSDSVPSYLALVLRWGRRQPQLARLGSSREIDERIAAWRSEIARAAAAAGESAAAAEARSRAPGNAVRQRIWDPVAELLRGAESVFVVPDGALHLVNLAALPGAGGKYLIDEPPAIYYLSAERDLIPVREQRREGDGLLALGGPNFEEKSLFASLAPQTAEARQVAELEQSRSRRSSCSLFETMRFEPLPGSEREVEEISALWRRSERTASGADSGRRGGPQETGAGPVRLIGSRATEASFKEMAPGRRVLHLATHGFFLPGGCEPASPSARGMGGLSTPGQKTAPPDPRQPEAEDLTPGENPLLLSGLALAGANHRAAAGPGEDDGILTAEEIAALDLSGVEWAVLSACDTGLGELRAGEGVLGLRRAFQVAGVRTLIMSLWPVDDEAAREWMKALYEGRRVRGLGAAEAVREASLVILNARRAKGLSTNPAFWAGFVATGDWR